MLNHLDPRPHPCDLYRPSFPDDPRCTEDARAGARALAWALLLATLVLVCGMLAWACGVVGR